MALSYPPPERLLRESLEALNYAPGWRVAICTRGVWRVRACDDAADAIDVLCAAAEDASAEGRLARVYLIDPCDDVVTDVEIRG